jgi:hypothetical protein
MNFDVYYPFDKDGKKIPGVKPHPTSWVEITKSLSKRDDVNETIKKIRLSSDNEEQGRLKMSLPAINFMGRCTGTRKGSSMTPTGFIMVDIDHCEDARKAWETLKQEIDDDWRLHHLMIVHLTSRLGLRIVFWANDCTTTVAENHEWFKETYKPERFGDFDSKVSDYSRISFMFGADDLLYDNTALYLDMWPFGETSLKNDFEDETPKKEGGKLFSKDEEIGIFTKEETEKFDAFEYRDTPIKQIIDKWVEVHGAPGSGEIHNYYNDMVKNFRNIMNNDKRLLLYTLPRFGHTAEECWSSIISICKVNTLSSLPKPFYFFLKDNGFYKSSYDEQGDLKNYMMEENETGDDVELPWLPPVFREFIAITPKDFRCSMINSLLPVMGTLTSYLQAKYYYDNRFHTTSFFSIVYAPPGTGKGFAEWIQDILFEDLQVRDYVQQARENIYLETINKKGDNEKSPDNPHTSLRIIPPKNSESEFLTKMQDNHGYHMFTYAAEMDSWAKGVRAAGGNKDDMIRIAWDNGLYGQQFKSASTFKGQVRLYWNVLITGTIQQIFSYFKNVENGLITRCSFTTIENQKYAEAPAWKPFSKKAMEVIKRFTERCDRNTYEEPCNLLPEDIDIISKKDFDKEINWKFKFKERTTVDMSWLKATIEKFNQEQLRRAAMDYDDARDVFRRRVAVRGFRLGLMCYALWDKPRNSDLQKCIPFIEWWMNQDIESMLKLWGKRYNSETQDQPLFAQKSLFNELSDAFTANDVYAQCMKLGIKTPVRMVIYQWTKLGYVKKIGKNEYSKIKKDNVKK